MNARELAAAIDRCARPGCGQPERAHQHRPGEAGDHELMAALGGACNHYLAPRIAVRVAALTIRANGNGFGPVCGRCGNRGCPAARCLYQPPEGT